MQLHKIKPFLQLSILSSTWDFSAEQHRNNSTAQSISLIIPINHRDDKTKPGRISHGNIFRRGQHLQLPLRRANPCELLGSADTFPEHSQSTGTSWLLSKAPAKLWPQHMLRVHQCQQQHLPCVQAHLWLGGILN